MKRTFVPSALDPQIAEGNETLINIVPRRVGNGRFQMWYDTRAGIAGEKICYKRMMGTISGNRKVCFPPAMLPGARGIDAPIAKQLVYLVLHFVRNRSELAHNPLYVFNPGSVMEVSTFRKCCHVCLDDLFRFIHRDGV